MGIGEVVALTGATRRTVQHYDRIGLVPAARDGRGRRVYRAADVTRLQLVRLLTTLGMPLAAVAEAVQGPDLTSDLQLLRRQHEHLVVEELRIRARLTAIGAIVEALDAVPGAVVSAAVLPVLIGSDDALPRHADVPDLDGSRTRTAEWQDLSGVFEVYHRWKAVSVRALVLADNGVDPGSPAGVDLGRAWQESLAVVRSGDLPEEVYRAGRARAEDWPAPDRELLARTEDYLQRCHDAYHGRSR